MLRPRPSPLSWLLLPLLACGGGGSSGTPDTGAGDAAPDTPAPPAARCDAPSVSPLAFRDVTGSVGIDALAGRASTADLDGDGYPDLILHRGGTHNRADFTAAPRDWPYRVLMNREAPGGGRRFEDRTLESGYGTLREPVDGVGRVAHLAVFGDVDDDGDVDVFSGVYSDRTQPDTDPGDRSELLLNRGDGTFELAPLSDEIRGSEDGRAKPTSSATFVDYDRDGRLDLFVGYWYFAYGQSLAGTQDRLLRGTGGGAFTDVTDALGLGTFGSPGDADGSRPTYGVTACDLELDGDVDLLASAYGRQWNQLWLHEADGTFRDIGAPSGFAGDDDLDYSDNELYRCYCAAGGCAAPAPRISCGSGGWTPGVDDQPFRLNGNTFATVCEDIDDDGDMDLYNAEIVHWHIGASSDSSQLLLQEGLAPEGGPAFARPGNGATGLTVPRVGVSWNEGGIDAAIADLDNDGRKDVLLATSDYPDQRLWIYRQDGPVHFAEVSDAAGLVHPCAPGLTLLDFDRDGDLDVLATSSTARDCAATWTNGPEVRLYENTGGQAAAWTRIELVGAGAAAGGANRSAIGAVVRVTAGGVTRTRSVQGGYGHFGMQHDPAVVVGLGTACVVDEIEVTWPDAGGAVERFTEVPAGHLVRIEQGRGLTYPEAS